MASKTERKTERAAERGNGRGGRPSRADIRSQMLQGAGSVAGILATIVTVVALIAALIIVAHIVFVLFDGNAKNELVKKAAEYAKNLAGPFTDLFNFKNGKKPQVKLTTVVNYGVAALAWVLGGRIIATLLRRLIP